MSYSYLESSSYGKDNVKFLKVVKNPKNNKDHEIMECNVQVLLKGEIETSFTEADNKVVVPTDTVKNTVLVLAKKNKTETMEKFAALLALHFTNKYSHITGVHVKIVQQLWNKYHEHSFIHGGAETKEIELDYDQAKPTEYKLVTILKGLTVLKSTNSMFHGFNVCEYTTLKPTDDRVLSTDVLMKLEFDPAKLGSLETVVTGSKDELFIELFKNCRDTTLTIFKNENSASVQATMFNMATKILQDNEVAKFVTYELPNKHYILFNLEWFDGEKNDNELYYPSSDPNGLIKCTVGRN
ncbi:hypothetical protein FOG48_01118 [Hanseniaspora uvarum]|nr:hypothetical protein FOG48_01118 [Hanseniaspora uvarum]